MRKLSIFLLAVFVLSAAVLCQSAEAEEVIAKCVSVPVGNHCIVRTQVGDLKQVRLWGVEQMDGDEAIREKAKARLSRLILNKAITVEIIKRDESGVCFAKLYVGDIYINNVMLKEGLLKINHEQAGGEVELMQGRSEVLLAENEGDQRDEQPPSDLSVKDSADSGVPEEALPVKVNRVIDGDSISVTTEEGAVERICLYGCDAPERGQEYSSESQEALSELLEGRNVQVLYVVADERRMKTAKVYADEVYVNRYMLERGHGMVPPSCSDSELKQLEAKSRDRKVGMWLRAAKMAPWVYRQVAEARRADARRRQLEQQLHEAEERRARESFRYSTGSYDSTPSSGGSVHVKGYYRKDGTYVRPHTRQRK